MSGAKEIRVGDYLFKGGDGVYLLVDPETRDPRATIVSQGNGTWRARTLDGEARTFEPPDGVERPGLWVAQQITEAGLDAG
ncbi:hypothetical protein AGRA3207_001680 [Actinomadura graeca]|uniref:Uncharacterized protein n=1 Tax=Actinomadura graeca TaxID=2750812 RepID=A0ABX8QT05_9ACTN|nr:hypothetical protein [Actinomadura graeca]QXJ20887.1 hypothetical protein AGRA3207_001680 [Actinomadura graeca]